MKNVLKYALLFGFCTTLLGQNELLNGKVSCLKFSNGLNYVSYNVNKKLFLTNRLEVLKTIETDINTFEINTSLNQFVDLVLINDIFIKIEQNSEFRIDLLNVVLKETNNFPSKINIENYNMNLALMKGEAYFVVHKEINDQALLQTPLSNFGLGNGKYWVQSDQKFVLIFILDGSLDIYDNITNKKENIKAGNVVLVRPLEGIVGKQADLFIDKITTVVKAAKPEQTRKMLNTIDEVIKIGESIVWINIDGKIIAVKIK